MMKPVLLLYATREGQTRRIAEHLAATLRARDLPVEVRDVAQQKDEVDLASFGAAVLAASIHAGKHEPEMIELVKRHRTELERMPTAFLSVSMTEATVEDPAKPAEAREKAAAQVREMIDRFLAETGWSPRHVRPVAGALLYSKYGLLVRLVMRFISKQAGGPTDTSRDHEFTDWQALDRFADELVPELED